MIPLRDTIPSSRLPIVTLCIIGINTLIFLGELGLTGQDLAYLFQHWGIVPLRFTHPRLHANYATLLSSMFIHGGWLHIIGNMWSLWIFGDNVEDRMGRAGFLLFYMTSGLAAGAVHIVTNPLSTAPTVGASGAIAGVMGAYLMLFPHATVITLVPIFFFIQIIELPAIFFLIFWFLTQLFSGTLSIAAAGAQQSGGVAWWAHIGGFVVGLLWAVPLRHRSDRVRRRRRYGRDDWW